MMKRSFKVQLASHKFCGIFTKQEQAIKQAREVAKNEHDNVEVLDMNEMKFVFTTGTDGFEVLYLPGGRRVSGHNIDLEAELVTLKHSKSLALSIDPKATCKMEGKSAVARDGSGREIGRSRTIAGAWEVGYEVLRECAKRRRKTEGKRRFELESRQR